MSIDAVFMCGGWCVSICGSDEWDEEVFDGVEELLNPLIVRHSPVYLPLRREDKGGLQGTYVLDLIGATVCGSPRHLDRNMKQNMCNAVEYYIDKKET